MYLCFDAGDANWGGSGLSITMTLTVVRKICQQHLSNCFLCSVHIVHSMRKPNALEELARPRSDKSLFFVLGQTLLAIVTNARAKVSFI